MLIIEVEMLYNTIRPNSKYLDVFVNSWILEKITNTEIYDRSTNKLIMSTNFDKCARCSRGFETRMQSILCCFYYEGMLLLS